MRSSLLACVGVTIALGGCFVAHEREPAAERAPAPTERAGMPAPVPSDPGHDICPETPGPAEACACGIATRLPHPDERGRCFLCSDCAECEIPNPEDGPLFFDALLVWQAPGGFAGTGPAVVVRGDGSVRIWHSVPAFDPEGEPDAPPDAELDLGFSQVDQLFLRLEAADTSSLPHEGGWAECYPSLYVRACEGCPELRLEYNATPQLRPELDCVMDWFGRLPPPSPIDACDA